jgi:sialate O-acetylesterase
VPLLTLPVKGVLLYQGESNAQEPERVAEYRELQKLMIASYRKAWKQPTMPFFWVQLSSIDSVRYKSRYWPWFRDEQRLLVKEIAHTGMAVCSDHGARHDVHPTHKKVVGERLALLALKQVFHKKVNASGPEVLRAEYKDNKVIVHFKDAQQLRTSDHSTLKGFSLDGRTPAEARIEKKHVILPTSTRPEFVYYGWQPYSEGNLTDEDGMPASTFKISVKGK